MVTRFVSGPNVSFFAAIWIIIPKIYYLLYFIWGTLKVVHFFYIFMVVTIKDTNLKKVFVSLDQTGNRLYMCVHVQIQLYFLWERSGTVDNFTSVRIIS